jgi:hypothetical protein
MINGHSAEPMVPLYRGFKGTMEPAYGGFRSVGVVSVSGVTTIEILELPVGTWINSYKMYVLEPMTKDTYQGPSGIGRFITSYTEHHNGDNILFRILMPTRSMIVAQTVGFTKVFKRYNIHS